MTAAWYWVVFALCALVLLVGVPLAARLEERAKERDRKEWLRMPGATR